MKKKLFTQTHCGAPVNILTYTRIKFAKSSVMKTHNSFLGMFSLYPQMYLVIFPEGTRYNPELKSVIAESQAFAAKEGTSTTAALCCCASPAC